MTTVVELVPDVPRYRAAKTREAVALKINYASMTVPWAKFMLSNSAGLHDSILPPVEGNPQSSDSG
jgi:hypothetical protein